MYCIVYVSGSCGNGFEQGRNEEEMPSLFTLMGSIMRRNEEDMPSSFTLRVIFPIRPNPIKDRLLGGVASFSNS